MQQPATSASDIADLAIPAITSNAPPLPNIQGEEPPRAGWGIIPRGLEIVLPIIGVVADDNVSDVDLLRIQNNQSRVNLAGRPEMRGQVVEDNNGNKRAGLTQNMIAVIRGQDLDVNGNAIEGDRFWVTLGVLQRSSQLMDFIEDTGLDSTLELSNLDSDTLQIILLWLDYYYINPLPVVPKNRRHDYRAIPEFDLGLFSRLNAKVDAQGEFLLDKEGRVALPAATDIPNMIDGRLPDEYQQPRALWMLVAADYLVIPKLTESLARFLVRFIVGRPFAYVQKFLGDEPTTQAAGPGFAP